MTRQELEDLGLSKEQADKVLSINKVDVEDAGKEVETENANLRKQVKERDKQLENLKASAGDNEELKPNMYRPKLDTSEYLVRMIVASTVVPDLYNKELQDSYGVKKPEDLVYEMVDDPGEYQDLCTWVQNFQGFSDSLDEKVDEAKN